MAMVNDISEDDIAAMLPPGMSIEDAMTMSVDLSDDDIANAMASIPDYFTPDDIEESEFDDFNPNDFDIE